MRPTRLRTNALETPLGVQTPQPYFSWALEEPWRLEVSSAPRNRTQSAFRLNCSTIDGKLMWDSGRVASSETLQVRYAGSTLSSSQRITWHVTVWDADGNEGEASRSWFETALLAAADWRGAEWIARYADLPEVTDCDLYAASPRNEAPRFRVEVRAPRDAVAVRAYVAGLGYHRLFVDGMRVGDAELEPGWTTVEHTVLYTVSDLDGHIKAGGHHAIGIELGNGWYNPLPLRFWGRKNFRSVLLGHNGTREPRARALVLAVHANGSTSVLARTAAGGTGGWRTGGSPTTFNNIYLGEHYDARLAVASAGWSSVGFRDPSWTPPVAADASRLGALVARDIPPVRRIERLWARELASHALGDGAWRVLLDTGRNHAGMCTWRVRGAAGARVAMRFGELLTPDRTRVNVLTSSAGQIKAPNPHAPCQPPLAYQGDVFTLSGGADGDVFTPAYSWHGFRYIEVELPAGSELLRPVPGDDPLDNGEPPPHDALGVCHTLRTDVASAMGFESSDPKLNRLHELVRHTYDANLMSVQSDCPHRERLGYGGDALGVFTFLDKACASVS